MAALIAGGISRSKGRLYTQGEVVHPKEDPQAHEAGWVEMLSDKITVYAEGHIHA